MKITPSDLLVDRQQWLLEDHSVSVTPNPHGGFDVVVRVDGTYVSRGDATKAAGTLQKLVHSATRKAIHAQQQVAQAQQRMDDL